MNGCNHPNIVRIIESYFDQRKNFIIVMEFIDGGDLRKKIDKNRALGFTEAKILDYVTQMCLGLKHLHDRHVIHRDLKPANIFITRRG